MTLHCPSASLFPYTTLFRSQLRAAPLRVARDVLEEERGALRLEDAPGDGPELAVPVHLGRDPAQLAFLLETRDPPAQVHEAHGTSSTPARAAARCET